MIYSLEIVWNFNPDLIKIGSFPIKYYSLMYVLAFVLGLQIMKRIYNKENVSLEKLDSLFIYTVIAMLLGARIGHYLFYEEDYTLTEVFLPFKLNPFEYTGFQGLASHGAAIGIIIAMYFYSKKVVKKPMLWSLDRLVIPTALGGMFVRLGNLFNSEIVGKETGTDVGFKFLRNDITASKAVNITKVRDVNEAYNLIAGKSEFANVLADVPNRYPTQIYEALGYLISFFILYYIYWKTDKKDKLGYIFGAFMVLIWGVRFVVEFFKAWQGGLEEWMKVGLNTGQLLSIPMILIGLYFMFRKTKAVS
ncbi:MAG: prolipoprotein diacylglyceryl transferase [Flavobacteriaceae bacterium]|nr:prolipoprotein diacylglyceryl transferase [Flavobacteriaceae bacterium]